MGSERPDCTCSVHTHTTYCIYDKMSGGIRNLFEIDTKYVHRSLLQIGKKQFETKYCQVCIIGSVPDKPV
jgi:hypothetical protein